MKKCFKCKEVKELSEFNKNKLMSDGPEFVNGKFEEVVAEIAKCEVLCANCHKDIHRKEYIPVTVFRIVDGDTVMGTIHLPYEVDIRNQEIRALGYDAWESRKVSRSGSVGISPEEIEKGKVAKAYLDSLMSEAKEVYIVPGLKPWDSFGRALGQLFIERVKGQVEDVAQLMSKGGHCRPCPLEESPNEDDYWDLDEEEDLTNSDGSCIV